jgi:anaerobic C4-dicarboxylate transporter
MGYPNVSNPTEKLNITEISSSKTFDSGYQVTCYVNGQIWLKEVYARNKVNAVASAMVSIKQFAKYFPAFKESV